MTCGACQYQCPVFIEHIPALQDMRRFLMMNEANMPETAAQTLHADRAAGPSRGAARRSRARRGWKALEVPTFDGTQEYLYWVGCSGALVDRNIPMTQCGRAAAYGGGHQLRRASATTRPATATRRGGWATSILYQMQAQATDRDASTRRA